MAATHNPAQERTALEPEELDAEDTLELPDREEMSIINPVPVPPTEFPIGHLEPPPIQPEPPVTT
jgi:hypothetical protein